VFQRGPENLSSHQQPTLALAIVLLSTVNLLALASLPMEGAPEFSPSPSARPSEINLWRMRQVIAPPSRARGPVPPPSARVYANGMLPGRRRSRPIQGGYPAGVQYKRPAAAKSHRTSVTRP
jgi:hypothetical protein